MRVRSLLAMLALTLSSALQAQTQAQITLVHMGGNDCPPCVWWRGHDLPKLMASPVFSGVRYVYITKSIRSQVPPAFFFPADAKDLHAPLAEASGGQTGSPHQAILVNGKVVDYWWGSNKGSAEELLQIITALKADKPYPRPACLKLDSSSARKCALPG